MSFRSLGEKSDLVRGRWPLALAMAFTMLPFGAGPDGAAEGSSLRQIVLVVLFLAATFAIIRFPARYAIVRQAMPVTFALLLTYVFLSVGWSPEPYVSFKRAIQLLGVTILGLGLVVGGSGKMRIASVTAPVLICAAALSIIVTAVFPTYAFSELGFRGFTANKNTFGQIATLIVFISGYMYLQQPTKRWLYLPMVLLGIAGLVISRSATSAMALLVVAALLAFRLALHRIHRSWLPLFLSGGLLLLASGLAYVVLQGFPPVDKLLSQILAPTGKDATLSGRTYLWELMASEAMHHPWFGTGYGGFWLGLQGPSGEVAYKVRWGYPGQAHNGYLDLFNELGFVGVVLVLAFLYEHTRNVFVLIENNKKLGYFHATLLLLVLVHNFAEATFLRTTHIWWIVFTASVLEVGYLTFKKSSMPVSRVVVGKVY